MTDEETDDEQLEGTLEAVAAVSAQLERYLRESARGHHAVLRLDPLSSISAELQLRRWITEGGLTGPALETFLDTYLETTIRIHHPGSMAHQVAVPLLPGAAIGALVDAVTNNPMAIYEMGPSATVAERAVVNWMLEKVGWVSEPDPGSEVDRVPGAGVLTHGGSLANLTALIAARSRVAPSVWRDGNPGRLAVFASPHAHYSTTRAVGILGLGNRSVLPLAVDDRGVIDPAELGTAYRRAVDDGWTPMAMVASACSTPVGLFDPLEPIGRFCRDNDLWLHVDGAHGASALLSDKTRHHLHGLQYADSLVWDAHKLLRVPSLCAAVLLRERPNLERAFEQDASYLFHDKTQPGIDLISRTVECTKAGLGLRFFLVLASVGEQQLGAYVERMFALTASAYRMVSSRPGFSCPVEPEANILCFRYGDSDELQLRLRDALLADGQFHISSTEYQGRRYLRLSLMSPTTDEAVIARLLDRIHDLALRGQGETDRRRRHRAAAED